MCHMLAYRLRQGLLSGTRGHFDSELELRRDRAVVECVHGLHVLERLEQSLEPLAISRLRDGPRRVHRVE